MDNITRFEDYKFGNFEIIGSDKQIKWATEILNRGIEENEKYLQKHVTDCNNHWELLSASKEGKKWAQSSYEKMIKSDVTPLEIYENILMVIKDKVLKAHAFGSNTVHASAIINSRKQIAELLDFDSFYEMLIQDAVKLGDVTCEMPDGEVVNFYRQEEK